MKTAEMLPLSAAAEQLKTTPLNILMHIKRGLLQGVEEDGVWLVERAGLAALMEKTGGAKAADLCAAGCSKAHGCGSSCG